MKYNFDKVTNRENTDCMQYDMRKDFFGRDDIIPMWVADMDYETPDFILDAIKKRLEHPILGYTFRSERFYNSITNWCEKRYNTIIKNEWIVFSPGVVPALNMAIQAFTNPGDKVLMNTPVYFPFFWAAENQNRRVITNKLKLENGCYTFDFEDFEQKLKNSDVKIFILSNPHNPGGTVWTKEELTKISNLCLKYNTLILSDEIHADLIMPGNKHCCVRSLSEDIANITITCIAPSKTFNTAGLHTSAIVISNEKLRNAFTKVISTELHVDSGNIFGAEALIAAYTHGEEWLEQLLEYINENINFTMEYLKKNIPEFVPMRPEATYLMWIDCSGLNMSGDQMNDFFFNKAKVAANPGTLFGQGGSGYMRLNLACPKSKLITALESINEAVKEIR